MREWMTVSSELLWRPEQYKPGHSHLSRFIRYLGEQGIARIEEWDALHEFSIEEPEAFWGAVIEYTGLKLQKAPDAILRGDSLISTEWLPGAQLNFAENLLAPVAAAPGQAERIISFFEDGRVVRHSNQDLLRDVASLRHGCGNQGWVPATGWQAFSAMGTRRLLQCWPRPVSERFGALLHLTSVSRLSWTVLGRSSLGC